jgi:hypothetical protein
VSKGLKKPECSNAGLAYKRKRVAVEPPVGI